MKQVLPRFSKPAPTILVNGVDVRLARHRCTRTRISQLRKVVVDWPWSVTAARVRLLVIGMHGSAKRYTCARGIPFSFCACAVDGNVPAPSRFSPHLSLEQSRSQSTWYWYPDHDYGRLEIEAIDIEPGMRLHAERDYDDIKIKPTQWNMSGSRHNRK